MKIILTTNIKKIGKVGDLVNVKDGFARNYLLPQKMALRDTKKNKEYFEKIKDEITTKEEAKKNNALEILNVLKNIKIEFIKEADDKDQLYGTVSKKVIINFFDNKNIKILSDDIKITKPIRNLGEHIIEINPYEGFYAELKVLVKKT